jgi:hypothetical protein|tara:strand:+ start:1050 stop:1289 length:240 start_codon:yes stop_codon:yes gene_type:complete
MSKITIEDITDHMKLAIDQESVNIYIDEGEDIEPTHIVYWHEDEWLEDSETVTPAIIQAINLFHTDKKLLLEKLGYDVN